ncbi:MAG: 2-phosphosulfolactate phosphatase [Bacteroidales bacterium]|nr:2-phosphosulfolactate phosphatase [Bacteroidales bacterium]
MEIQILQLVEGARRARGLTVVIDVFRAFSTACYVMGNGAEEIFCVGKVETAFDLKKKHPDYILLGERNERMVEGFQFGNSPCQVEHMDFRGKTLVHTTSAGTQGLVNATGADEVLCGSFVNADAIIDYIRRQNPDRISLVCMGYAAQYPIEEDTLCAEYIRGKLNGENPDFSKITEIIRKSSGKRFFIAGNQGHAPSTDFYLCLDINRFDFVLEARPLEPGILSLKTIKNVT